MVIQGGLWTYGITQEVYLPCADPRRDARLVGTQGVRARRRIRIGDDGHVLHPCLPAALEARVER